MEADAAARLAEKLTRGKQWVIAFHKFVMAGAGAILLLLAFVAHRLGHEVVRLALVFPAYALCGWYTFKDMLRLLRQMKFDIDLLMFAAALGAAALGHYEEGGLLLFLFALGNAGEEMAMDRARRAIHALAKLAPETAMVREADGREREVRIEELQIGERVVIRPFDRVPADGTVVAGASAVDQSPITGESVPAEKAVGSVVFAGTINGEGLLVAAVTKLASQSTLARIVTLVNEAQTTKSPTQLFTDQVERWYVPLVLVATTLLVFVPPLLGWGAWSIWFYRAMAFLTAASPCALAIGTPAAVLSGIARAARSGVLIKGGVHLENLGRIKAVAFDKTGTLTRGRPELVDVVAIGGMGEAEILELAAAVERGSSHPLAAAIVAEAQGRQLMEWRAVDLEQVPALGVVAVVEGRKVAVGRLALLGDSAGRIEEARKVVEQLSRRGHTTVVVGVDGNVVGVLGLADRARENAADCINQLRRLGVKRTIMITGDNVATARAVAGEIGVDEFHAELMPEDKVRLVKRLQEENGAVAMVGDGINDAPAMACATVGIAMGGAGADVALETADVALMADDLGKLPEAIALSRQSRRIITQNLIIALGVIAVVSPIAAMGGATLGLAVLLHEGSTVVVVCNSLRLLAYKHRRPVDNSRGGIRRESQLAAAVD